MREARRQNQIYQRFSLKCLGDIILIFDNVDAREEVLRVVEPIIRDAQDSQMDVDSNGGAFSNTT